MLWRVRPPWEEKEEVVEEEDEVTVGIAVVATVTRGILSRYIL